MSCDDAATAVRQERPPVPAGEPTGRDRRARDRARPSGRGRRAAGLAGRRLSRPRIARALREPARRLPRRPGRGGLRRGTRRRDRFPLGGRALRAATRARAGPGCAPGRGPRRARRGADRTRREGRHRDDPDRVRDGRRPRRARGRSGSGAPPRQRHGRVQPERGGVAQAAGIPARGRAVRRHDGGRLQSDEPDRARAAAIPARGRRDPRRAAPDLADRQRGGVRAGLRRGGGFTARGTRLHLRSLFRAAQPAARRPRPPARRTGGHADAGFPSRAA